MASRSSSADRLFAPFEGTREPTLVAVFRIAFFAGLALHFFPSLLWLDDGYAPGSLRTAEWSHWLFLMFGKLPHAAVRGLSIVTMLGCLMGIVGYRPRLAAVVAGLGCYTFASFNGLRVQTLAIVNAWAILLAWMICGGGGGALSLDALLRRPRGPAREPRLLPALILFQALLAVFFSGFEKLLTGWPGTNEMAIVMAYPRGFMARDWVWSSDFLRHPVVTHAFSWFTMVVELGTPIALMFRRTRVWALLLYELFFLGIIAMLEVPPLFYCMFAFAAPLALDDQQVEALVGLWRRGGKGGGGSAARGSRSG